MKAADEEGRAVTAVTFWDGSDGDLHLFDHVEQADEECSCCLDTDNVVFHFLLLMFIVVN